MNILQVRIKSYRTIRDEVSLDVSDGLTIVGQNSSGKTNILKAIQLFFSAKEQDYKYSCETDLPSEHKSARTSMVVSFVGDPDGLDKDLYEQLDELHDLMELPRNGELEFAVNLQFSGNSKPSYQLFPGRKKPQQLNTGVFSQKQSKFVDNLLSNFTVYYVPSEKSIKDLYNDILLPFLHVQVAKSLEPHVSAITNVLNETAEHLTDALSKAGLNDIKARFELPGGSVENLLGDFEFHLLDPVDTPIASKGMGVQSTALLASFLWVTSRGVANNTKAIWLLEEPESYLHPGLASNTNKLISALEKIALVIRTTHSLSFVPADGERVVGTSIEKGSGTIVETFNTYKDATNSIRKSLGVQLSDFYNFAKYNVLVEGQGDKDYFKWLLDVVPSDDVLGNDCRWGYLRDKETAFLDWGGVKFLEAFLASAHEYVVTERPVVSVFDGDSAGIKSREALQGRFGNKSIPFDPGVHFVTVANGNAIEALFPDEWIKTAYNDHSGWFETFDFDVATGRVMPFKIKDGKKDAYSKYMKSFAEFENDFAWAEKWINVASSINYGLRVQHEKLSE